mgnify:CR=1 FL=1
MLWFFVTVNSDLALMASVLAWTASYTGAELAVAHHIHPASGRLCIELVEHAQENSAGAEEHLPRRAAVDMHLLEHLAASPHLLCARAERRRGATPKKPEARRETARQLAGRARRPRSPMFR